MYLCILFLPLLAALIANNKWTGIQGGPKISISIMILTTLLSLIGFYEISITSSDISINLLWFNLGNYNIEWNIIYDSITITMLMPVMIISTCVQIYSYTYLENDPHLNRFFSLLSLFTFAMLLLISGNNLFLIFLGWELVGLVSYLLVNYWFTGVNNNLAALKALFINKFGDWSLILTITLSLAIFGSIELSTIFSLSNKMNEELIMWLSITILIAASAKSAQLGLHTWLASAMAGPTSVSSLLHSSTMVTAGVFLLIRMSPLIEYSDTVLILILWLGSFTALLGAACGLVDNDIKKIIAYSTCSQLGYLFVACGLSQYTIALTHLLNHAVFKSLLFLASGAFIHAIFHQDIRKMGSLVLLSPISYLVFLLGSLSLVAFPFFTGFYSKDFLLELLIVPLNFTHSIAYIFTLLAALFTVLYSLRLLIQTMYSLPQFSLIILPYVKDSPNGMTLPMLFLAIGAVIFGFISHELFLGFGHTFYNQSIFILPEHLRLFDGLNNSEISIIGLLPLIFLILLLIPLIFPSFYRKSINNSVYYKSNNVINSWRYSNRFDPSIMNNFNILNNQIIMLFFKLSLTLYRYIDKGLLEFFGPIGIYRLIHWLGFKIELLSTGLISHYGLFFMLFILLSYKLSIIGLLIIYI